MENIDMKNVSTNHGLLNARPYMSHFEGQN